MRHAVLSLAFLAFILLSCSLGTPVEQESTIDLVRSGDHTTCVNCHDTKHSLTGDAPLVPETEPSDVCLYCHDYETNHHPVNFVPITSINERLPLFDGQIKCLTCHEMHGGEGLSGAPKLLRGGPYADRRETCFGCHDQEAYAAINPHHMLNSDGEIRLINDKPVCLVCHSIKPNPAVDRTEDVKFKADVAFLCWRCHPPMPGDFFREHFLIKPAAETLKYMLTAEKELDVITPLVPRDRITCSTCHNPHQEGIIRHHGAAKGAGVKSGLRIEQNCIACHPN